MSQRQLRADLCSYISLGLISSPLSHLVWLPLITPLSPNNTHPTYCSPSSLLHLCFCFPYFHFLCHHRASHHMRTYCKFRLIDFHPHSLYVFLKCSFDAIKVKLKSSWVNTAVWWYQCDYICNQSLHSGNNICWILIQLTLKQRIFSCFVYSPKFIQSHQKLFGF